MEHKNMNCKEKYHGDGNTAVEDQDNGKLVQDHAKQTGSEGNDDQTQ